MLQENGIDAPSFEELANTAVATLRGRKNLAIVCGPITTGGTGNQTYNFQVFNAVVRGLTRCGKHVFNQIPYEYGLRRLAHKWEAEGNNGYCMPILTVFYARILESGAFGEGDFIPGWRSSFGAQWERAKLIKEGCHIHDLTRANVRSFLLAEYPAEHVGAIMALLSPL